VTFAYKKYPVFSYDFRKNRIVEFYLYQTTNLNVTWLFTCFNRLLLSIGWWST